MDLLNLHDALGKIPEKEWPGLLSEMGIKVPETPHVLQRWGTPNSRVAYSSYVIKQALGQRLAAHYQKSADDFLSSPQGKEVLAKSRNSEELRQNMPQILLSIAASGEVPLQATRHCSMHCQTRMGEKAYEQLRQVLDLETFNWDSERVTQWIGAISALQDQRPDFWKAMHTRVQDAKANQQIREFFEERGFHRFADQYRYSGSFIQTGLVPIRFDSQATLGVGIKKLFASEDAMCCGTSCGNCPLGFPPVLKDAQIGLASRNKRHVATFRAQIKENLSVYSSERDLILRSIDETQITLNSLRPDDFGIYSKQDEKWLDEHFRKGVLQAEAEFLVAERELVVRHSRHNPELRARVLSLLSNPMLNNYPGLDSLRSELSGSN